MWTIWALIKCFILHASGCQTIFKQFILIKFLSSIKVVYNKTIHYFLQQYLCGCADIMVAQLVERKLVRPLILANYAVWNSLQKINLQIWHGVRVDSCVIDWGWQRLRLRQHPFGQSTLLNILGQLVNNCLQLTVHL